jgi:hypothetical protein
MKDSLLRIVLVVIAAITVLTGLAQLLAPIWILVSAVLRTWSWIVDGRPAALFIAFLALEACVFIAVAVQLRISHGQA